MITTLYILVAILFFISFAEVLDKIWIAVLLSIASSLLITTIMLVGLYLGITYLP